MRSNYFLFLFAFSSMLVFVSCERTIEIHPIYQAAFKPLEASSFVMVCDSLNDTIEYKTQKFNYSYEKKGLYSSTELQTISLYASIVGDLNNILILNMDLNPYGNEEDLLSIEMQFKILNAGLTCTNNTVCFSNNFNNEFNVNGINYINCWFYNYPNSNGDLATFIVYSPKVGVLRLISGFNGAIYTRCFACE